MKVRIAVPRALHSRVIKAVTKEKWLDLEYKYQLLELEDKRAELSISTSHNVITFLLHHIRVNRLNPKIPVKLSDLV